MKISKNQTQEIEDYALNNGCKDNYVVNYFVSNLLQLFTF